MVREEAPTAMGVTIKDIARIAEVSPAAVSLVLNDKPGVGEETRARVLRVAKELDYRPPRNSDHPQANVDSICLLHVARHGHALNRDHDVFVADYIEGLSQGAKAAGMSLEIMTFKTTPVEKVIALATEHPAAGFIVLGTELSAADAALFSAVGKPVIFIDTYLEFLPFDFVDMNNGDSVYTIVSYLASRGHRRIGLIRSSIETRNFKLREEGFKASLASLALPYDEDCCFAVDSTFHGAYEDLRTALAEAQALGRQLPTAFFCANDIIACGCLKAFSDAGIRVPEDVSLVGFDDLPLSAVVEPPMTTIRVSKAQIGKMAVQLVTARIRAENQSPPVKVLISGELVERRSVKDLSE